MDQVAISTLAETSRQLGEHFRPVLASAAACILADEASFWMKIPSRDSLLMVLIGNPAAANMALVAVQPLDTGLVNRVFLYGELFQDPHSLPIRDHSKKIDIEFSQTTHHMAVVPVTVGSGRIGVVSAVKFPHEGDRIWKSSDWNFSRDALEVLDALASQIAEALPA